MTVTDKLRRAVERHEQQRRQMVASVRRAYVDGRWQAATTAQRRAARRNFRILRAQRVRAERELARRGQT